MGQSPDAVHILQIQQNHLARFPFREGRGDGLHTFLYQFSDIHDPDIFGPARAGFENYKFSGLLYISALPGPASKTF